MESCRRTDLGELNIEVPLLAGSEADKLSETFEALELVVAAGSAVDVTD